MFMLVLTVEDSVCVCVVCLCVFVSVCVCLCVPQLAWDRHLCFPETKVVNFIFSFFKNLFPTP